MLTGKRKQNNLRSRRTINAANALESKIQIFNIFNNQRFKTVIRPKWLYLLEICNEICIEIGYIEAFHTKLAKELLNCIKIDEKT